jgi:hypothetical protein
MIKFIISILTNGSSIPWIIGGVISLVTAFFIWLAIHDNTVWNKAIENFNTMQQEIDEKKKDEYIKDTENINNNASRIRHIISEKEDKINDINNNIEKKAINENNGSDQASPYLKNIIDQLNKNYGIR